MYLCPIKIKTDKKSKKRIMKPKFSSLLVGISLFMSVASFANDKSPKITSALRTQVVDLIGDKIPFNTEDNLLVRVSFVVNNQNELVVVDVISKDEKVNAFIKEKINYRKIKASKAKSQEIYLLPIKVKK